MNAKASLKSVRHTIIDMSERMKKGIVVDNDAYVEAVDALVKLTASRSIVHAVEIAGLCDALDDDNVGHNRAAATLESAYPRSPSVRLCARYLRGVAETSGRIAGVLRAMCPDANGEIEF